MHRCTTLRVNPKANCGLGVITKPQCWFGSGEGRASARAESIWDIPVGFSQFFYDVKLLKNAFLKNHETEIIVKEDSLLLV